MWIPVPSSSELERLDEAVPGSAQKIFDMYLAALQAYERRRDEAHLEHFKEQRHLRLYRYFSVLSGVFLAVAALGLCAFGIERQANLYPIAALLTPIAGLAGPKTQEVRADSIGVRLYSVHLDAEERQEVSA